MMIWLNILIYDWSISRKYQWPDKCVISLVHIAWGNFDNKTLSSEPPTVLDSQHCCCPTLRRRNKRHNTRYVQYISATSKKIRPRHKTYNLINKNTLLYINTCSSKDMWNAKMPWQQLISAELGINHCNDISKTKAYDYNGLCAVHV